MFLTIIDEFKSDGGISVFALSNNRIVTAYSVPLVDTEQSEALEQANGAFSLFLKSLHPKATARFWLLSQPSNGEAEEKETDHSRAQATAEIGHVVNRCYLIIEIEGAKFKNLSSLLKPKFKTQPLEAKAAELLQSFDTTSLTSAGIILRPLKRAELQSLLPTAPATAVTKLSYALDFGSHLIGIVRLIHLGTTPLTPVALAQLKDRIPLPYKIKTSARRVSDQRAETLLRRKSAQSKESTSTVGASKYAEAEDALSSVALGGQSMLEFEMFVELERSDERTLRADMNEVVQILKALGDFAIETVGVFPSYLSAQIGFDQHVSILETDQILPCFLPVWSEGEADEFKAKPMQRSLALHRRDESLLHFDVFNPSADNFSVCIFGKSGRGKSVLTNLLTRSLLNDPDIRMIKVDVGGSHSKETELLGGEEFQLSMSQPSGLNPFAFFGRVHSEDVCNIIATFLGILLIEEGEKVLSKSMRGEIEKAVTTYSLSKPREPSIDDFYTKACDLPRRSLLARWVSGGAYGNAFAGLEKGKEGSGKVEARIRPTSPFEGSGLRPDHGSKSALIAADSPSSSLLSLTARLKYYNLSEIFQAADGDYAQGVMAAIIAMFNLELINCKGSRLAFVADETPFFIERCFPFFKFSTANVRKFGGSFITIAQKSSDVVINGDTGILENSNSKFLFSIDGEKENFAKRLKLEPEVVDRIEGLRSEKGTFSEALLTDHEGAKVLRIQLTAREYWSATSSHEDNRKLDALRASVPGLSLQQAINVLSQNADS